ncbi:sensor histidine kinase [Emticicia sp. BO119]|uniref:sensor histidine kinase n=1 Tax=Emticicia sp. BO119 TaxID=2757768 RepID=UPI0015F058B7|nr:sensor histidine kinase [Emticicia sp. BO119]MBA4853287.1 sensor histidine kinase [Emticicia sp. BO119]
MKFLKRYSIWLHIIGWIVFVIMPFLTIPNGNFNAFRQANFQSFVISQLINDIMLIAIFYFNLNFLTPTLFIRKNIAAFVSYMVAIFILMLLLNKFTFDTFVKPNFQRFPRSDIQVFQHRESPRFLFIPFPFFFRTTLSFSLVILASSLLALIKEHGIHKEEKQQIALEKTAAELAVLKLQISPHFLFNTLNNIRWLARQKSDKTEDSVVKLSQLLRYMIYQAKNDKVSLTQEINYLKNYIELQKMRLAEKNEVRFTYVGDIKQWNIEPLLFIPFVENAFKYGLHSQQESLIEIILKVEGSTLNLFVKNPVFANNSLSDAEDSGIGIQNVEKRLMLHYPERHELNIVNIGGYFSIDLTIILTDVEPTE